MTTPTQRDRSHESIINDALARFLRDQCNLDAVAETLHDGKRPDIIVRLSEGPVILEVELEPAPTVEADALSRLGMEIAGSTVQNSYAVTVPERIRVNPPAVSDRPPGERNPRVARMAHRWHIRS